VNSVIIVPAVRDYAEAVRRELTGLSPEQVRDLTDDLEMDLTDALADSGGLTPGGGAVLTFNRIAERFGDPGVYADELRAGADLPARGARTASAAGGGSEPDLVARPSLRELRQAALARWRQTGWWQGAARLGRVMRPAWWAIRALAVLALGYYLLGGPYLNAWFLAVALCAVMAGSMALGRVAWREQPKPTRALMAVLNVVCAVITSWVALMVATDRWEGPQYQGERNPGFDLRAPSSVGPNYQGEDYGQVEDGPSLEQSYCETHLCFGGEPVRNIYAFDAEGNPLSNVQLFNQDGRPLDISDPSVAEDGSIMESPADGPPWWSSYEGPNGDFYTTVPSRAENGDPLWNVFPLAARQWSFDSNAGIWRQSDEPARVPPFAGVARQVAE
jgi:hypothetical protein